MSDHPLTCLIQESFGQVTGRGKPRDKSSDLVREYITVTIGAGEVAFSLWLGKVRLVTQWILSFLKHQIMKIASI